MGVMIPATVKISPKGKITRVQSTTGYGVLDIVPEVTERKRFPQVFNAGVSTPINRLALIWTVDRQARAMDMGFFLHRAYPDNHAVVIPKRSFKTAREVLAALKDRAAKDDTFAIEALTFIKQQDEYGFRNAWDPTVRNHTHTMLWYKRLRKRTENRVGFRERLHKARTEPRPPSEAHKPPSERAKRIIAKLEAVDREWAGGRSIKAIEASIKRTEDVIAKAEEGETRAYAAIEQAKEQMRVGREALEAYKRERKRAKFMSL